MILNLSWHILHTFDKFIALQAIFCRFKCCIYTTVMLWYLNLFFYDVPSNFPSSFLMFHTSHTRQNTQITRQNLHRSFPLNNNVKVSLLKENYIWSPPTKPPPPSHHWSCPLWILGHPSQGVFSQAVNPGPAPENTGGFGGLAGCWWGGGGGWGV